MRRRDFLTTTAAAAGAALAPPARATGVPRVRRYVPLGATGLEISDVSFGSSRSDDPALVRHALERGVNYFDTAESYRGGRAEEAIGEALAGRRHEVAIATKHKAWGGESRRQMMTALEASLRRLRTDYVDVYFNHAVNDRRRLENPEWREFTDRAKRDGKIRFRGVSGHGSKLVECLDYALDNDLADVVLTAFNFAQDPDFYDRLRHTFHYVALQPDLPRVLAKARVKGVGVVAMKALVGARLNDMRPYETGGTTFAQAALRWVLASANVDALVISMTGPARIDEYVASSGAPAISEADVAKLTRYAWMNGGRYCQHGCGACESSCPHGVAIPEVLRTRMYDVDYGDRRLARDDYAALGAGAAACLTCAHAACLGSCPNGLPIAAFTRDAATRLG